jgi:hypothetical protein
MLYFLTYKIYFSEKSVDLFSIIEYDTKYNF